MKKLLLALMALCLAGAAVLSVPHRFPRPAASPVCFDTAPRPIRIDLAGTADPSDDVLWLIWLPDGSGGISR